MVVISAGSAALWDGKTITLKRFELAKFDVTRAEFAIFTKETGFHGAGCETFNENGDFETSPDADWQHPRIATMTTTSCRPTERQAHNPQ